MRAEEVAELTEKADGLKKEIDDSEHTAQSLVRRIGGLESGERKLDEIEKELASSPEYNLPDPPALMTAKAYKTKFADPIIKALKELVKTILVRFFQLRNEYSRVIDNNGRLWREGDALKYEVNRLKEENTDLRRVNTELRKQNKDHALLRKIFGSEQIDNMILQAKQLDEQQRKKKKGWDR